MSEIKRRQINFRIDEKIEAQINWLRRSAAGRPLTVREVMRQALEEKFQRERESKKGARR